MTRPSIGLGLVLFSVLFASHQIVAAIDLARLYGHDGHDVQKRSGELFFKEI